MHAALPLPHLDDDYELVERPPGVIIGVMVRQALHRPLQLIQQHLGVMGGEDMCDTCVCAGVGM